MAHDVAKTIVDMANQLEKHDSLILEITHGFMDEYSVSKCMRVRQKKDRCVLYYKNTSVIFFPKNKNCELLDIILQQILCEFLDITESQDGHDCFTVDMDYLEIKVHADEKVIASGIFYFPETIFRHNISSYIEWFDADNFQKLKNMFCFYVRFASMIKKNKVCIL